MRELTGIYDLPGEIIACILGEVDALDALCFSQTSKYFNPLVYNCMTVLKNAPGEELTDEILLRMPNLTELDLDYNEDVTGSCFSVLTRLKTLKMIQASKIRSSSLKILTNLTSLELDPVCKHITNKSIENMKSLEKVALFEYDSSRSTGRGKRIDKYLFKLPSLTSLTLHDNTMIQDKDIQKLTNLKILTIEESSLLSDEGLRVLTQLESLEIRDNKKITGSCFRELQHITKICIDSENSYRTKMDYNNFSYLTNLIDLEIVGDVPIDDLIPQFTSLQNLSISENDDITGESLTNLVNLKHLDLFDHRISFNDISMMTNLSSIMLYEYTDSSRAFLRAIRDSPNSNIKIINNQWKENYFTENGDYLNDNNSES